MSKDAVLHRRQELDRELLSAVETLETAYPMSYGSQEAVGGTAEVWIRIEGATDTRRGDGRSLRL